ncbi:hypothetical protein ENU1_166060 [Entamoeba nuttalli P19]|uniref:Uncharacterized protein n=2 Tax=Entamoeba nuttalli TaxID=412467 RepID=K2HR31_ENTNP|nr:hypothetical protein ENU1_166060 [Entamoeba nuttalli P19]EKE38440.1 hypothetical protein ENU1_166060 [Entamoeba nuttalli P19]|eukprot:XP_008859224.1 hypothetical protein ENU1_166060 [Entamoeba nuttalli P19]
MKVLLLTSLLLLSTLAQETNEELQDFNEEENVQISHSEFVRPRKPQPASERKDLHSKSYKMEYMTLFFVIIYFVYFFIGKSSNTSVVTEYAHFAHAAIFKYFKKGNRKSEVPVGIMSVSCNNFVIECYDHPLIKGACLNFNLVKRQELFNHLFSFITKQQDELIIDVVFNKGIAPPCIYGICKSKQEKKLRKQYSEIAKFCKTRNGAQMKLSEKYVVFSDAFDSTGILNQPMIDFINLYEKEFNYFILSDQSTSIRDEKSLMRCSIKICNGEIISKVTDLIFGLANSINKVTIKPYLLEKCKAVRAEIQEEEEKERAKKIREENAERIEKEKAMKINAMTPEERRKYEEKQRNKLVKRKQVKVRMG